jgi:hypothetical protein
VLQTLPYDAGRRRAFQYLGLGKFAAYSPEQLNAMQRHWGVTDPAQMLEMNRARALAPQGPAAAQATQTWNASRGRAGLGPMTSQPVSGLGWQPGQQNPVPIRGAAPDLALDRLSGGNGLPTGSGPAPRPMDEAAWAGRRANIPAAPPSTTPVMTRMPRTMPMGDSTMAGIRRAMPAAAAPAAEGTVAGIRRAMPGFAKTLLKAVIR